MSSSSHIIFSHFIGFCLTNGNIHDTHKSIRKNFIRTQGLLERSVELKTGERQSFLRNQWTYGKQKPSFYSLMSNLWSTIEIIIWKLYITRIYTEKRYKYELYKYVIPIEDNYPKTNNVKPQSLKLYHLMHEFLKFKT